MLIRYQAHRIGGLRNLMLFLRSRVRRSNEAADRRKEKIIFLHIPKTAGTSLRKIVSKEYARGRCLYIYNHHPDYIASFKKMAPAAEAVYGHLSFGTHELLDIQGRYVAFLRDPIARVLSFYNHQVQIKNSTYHDVVRRGASLLDMLEDDICHEMNNHMVRIISGHGGTQMVDDTRTLDRALANIENHFVFVGIVEQMSESVARLSHELHFKNRHTIPRRNVTRQSHLKEPDAMTREAIEHYNRLDIALYQHIVKSFVS